MFSFGNQSVDSFIKNMSEHKRLMEEGERRFVYQHLSVVAGWNDGYINIQELAVILAEDIHIIGKAERFFSSYDYLNNIIKPSIASGLIQGTLLVKDTIYRASVPPQAINTAQLHNYLATVNDIKKWLDSIDRPLPLILRCDKADYPISFKNRVSSYWDIWPNLKTAEIKRNDFSPSVSNQEPNVEWQKALVEQWPRIRAYTVEYPTAQYALNWLKNHDDTGVFINKGDSSEFYWRCPTDKQKKRRAFTTFENAFSSLKQKGHLPDEITPRVT